MVREFQEDEKRSGSIGWRMNFAGGGASERTIRRLRPFLARSTRDENRQVPLFKISFKALRPNFLYRERLVSCLSTEGLCRISQS
jgi:hypothetical protein